MKIYCFLLFILIGCGVAAQNDTTLYYFNEVGIYVNVPSKFKVLTAEESKRIRGRGERAMEDANDLEIDASTTTTLISIKDGPYNYLDVTITPYKNYTHEGYAKDNKMVSDMIYNTFVDKVSAESIDTSSSRIRLNGIAFEVFQMKIKLAPSATMKMFLLSKYYKGYDLGISYVYVDEIIGKELEAIVQGFTFKK